jgi:hypothetical protein
MISAVSPRSVASRSSWSTPTRSAEVALSRLLGVFLILIVVRMHLKPNAKWRPTLPAFAGIGAGASFLSALQGSVGPLMAPFFLAYGLVKGAYIGNGSAFYRRDARNEIGRLPSSSSPHACRGHWPDPRTSHDSRLVCWEANRGSFAREGIHLANRDHARRCRCDLPREGISAFGHSRIRLTSQCRSEKTATAAY